MATEISMQISYQKHELNCCCCVASVVSDSMRPHGRQPTRDPAPGILQARTLTTIHAQKYLHRSSGFQVRDYNSTWVKEVLYFEEILRDTQWMASNFLKQEIKLYPEKIGFQGNT